MPAADGAGSRGWRGDFVDVIAAELLKRLPGGFSAFCAGAGDESGRNPLKRRPATRIRHDRFRARAEGACPALEFRHQFHWLQPAWRIEGIFTGQLAELPAGIQGPDPGRPRVLDEPTICGRGTGRTRRDRVEFIRELPQVVDELVIRRGETFGQDRLHGGIRAFGGIPHQIRPQPRQQGQRQGDEDDEEDGGTTAEHYRAA